MNLNLLLRHFDKGVPMNLNLLLRHFDARSPNEPEFAFETFRCKESQ